MMNWLTQLNTHLLPWWPLFVVVSIAMVVISAIIIPRTIAKLPADYLTRPRPRTLHTWQWCLRNLAALVLLLAGLLMLVLPGQGVLTIVIALLVADMPGIRRFECALMRRPAIFKALNWVRRHAQRPPFDPPHNGDS